MSKVPKKIAAKLMFLTDLRCCVCKKRGNQIHHIDGNNRNHKESNLAFLCFDHHDEATRSARLSRGLSRETITLFKDEWHERVRKNREVPKNIISQNADSHLSPDNIIDLMLEAQQIHEIRKIRYELSGLQWDEKLQLIKKLEPYGDEGSIRVRQEVIYALQRVANKARHKMPQEIATAISGVTRTSLPIWHLLYPVKEAVSAEEQSLLEEASSIGLYLAYDGAKYLRNLKIVDAGGDILWEILRYSHLNNLLGPKKHALEEFEAAIDGATHDQRDPFPDAVRWLTFLREDALKIDDDDRLPEFPDDLAQKIIGISLKKSSRK